jgi:serine/threonine protein kinase/peptidoglycan hydrolase-like protein with peptidoglycan-binding domain
LDPDNEAKARRLDPAEPRGVLPPGTRLRTYVIGAVLGQGSFGITYRARDTQLDRDVAIKEYLPTSLALRDAGTLVVPRSTEHVEEFVWGRERFLDEARTLAKLGHVPSIVRVFDFLEGNGTAYTVMGLVEGETLERRLKRDGRLSPDNVDRLLRPLLDGLEQVHAIGFLHRDIKPANLIVDKRGAPTLIDFGASRAAIGARTGAMTAIFTPGYAAGEQFTSARQGPWTDIYGLSATIYHAIAGAPPPSAFDRMLEDEYRPLAALKPDGLSLELLAAIDAGLRVRATDRPQSIEAWRAILNGGPIPLAADATLVLPSHGPIAEPLAQSSVSTSAMRSLRLRLYAAGLVVAVILAAGAGWSALRPMQLGTGTHAVQDLNTVDLERLLAARRKADAEAAEKQRLEQEAVNKAAADSAAKQAADMALAKAEADRQKAEVELAQLKAEIDAQKKLAADQQQASATQQQGTSTQEAQRRSEEARQKAEAEMAALRKVENDARAKAVADAETKRQADEALAHAQAERQKADAEAEAMRHKAADDTRLKADADAKQKAELDETALRLNLPDRQRLQVALSSLGFATRGTDGAFGPRSREMITAWQGARKEFATGYLTAAQQSMLLREAAAAVARFDDEQKKAAESPPTTAKPPTAAPVAAAPASRTSADPGRILEQKSVAAQKISGLPNCGATFTYLIRIYPQKFSLNLGNEWHDMSIDSAGRFAIATFRSASSGNRFTIHGTLSPREFYVDNVDLICTWKGVF